MLSTLPRSSATCSSPVLNRNKLLDIPHDILSHILRKLRLDEIGNICQTCSFLNSFVTNDKQLWLHIIERDIRSKALPFPKYIRDIDELTAQDVIEWVKNSMFIDNGYSSGKGKTLIRVNMSMSVTWVKLVRGRWCLIACSDLRESQLVVWDLRSSQAEHHKASFYLPGPIVDGVVEDNRDEILIALTVGTKMANILLLQFYADENEASIHQLFKIPAASHVRLLKRPYIGFAVRDGDDTNPSILNWETGCLRSFVTPGPLSGLRLAINDAYPLSLKHAPCRGMFIWRNLIIVLDTGKLAVFGRPGAFDQFDDIALSSSQCERVHYLDGAYVGASVLNFDDHLTANGSQDTLRLILHEGSGFVARLLIRYDEVSEVPGKLVFGGIPGRLELPTLENDYESEATKLAVGSTCGWILTLALIQHISWPMPTIYITQLIPTEDSIAYGPAIPISTDGMPLLFDVTCMDFDDGNGLLVTGTHRGDVCIRSFGAALPPSGLNCELPSLRASPDFKVRIPIDLPTIYEVHSAVLSQDSRRKLTEEASRAWGTAAPAPHLRGWSSDWSQFQNAEQWLTPFPRWGIYDNIVNGDNMVCMRIRWRLGTLGEMIPVLFNEENHCRVLFRTGDQLYYCRSKSINPEVDNDRDFEDVDDIDILGIFPITYTQFLQTDPITIAELIDDPWMQRDIEFDYSSLAAKSMLDQEWMFIRVKRALVEQLGEYPGDEVLEAWSNSEWAAMRKVAGIYA